MSSLNDIAEQSSDDSDPEVEWVMAAKVNPDNLLNHSLVLSAVGIDHQVDRASGVILVQKNQGERAMYELQAFREENQNWPPPANYLQPVPRTDNPPTLLMFGGLILFYTVTGGWFAENPWFQEGAINSRAILEQGEWWRLLTALTLHADQMHLVGNCVVGGFMVHLLCKTIGYGTGWLTLLMSGMLANLLNIVFRDSPHYSVGFSTAIFAAIGIFCGRQLRRHPASFARTLLLPLGAGIGLLAMLGSEGKQTDFGAHLFGLGCGFAAGLFLQLTRLDQQGDKRSVQQAFFTATLVLILICWQLARG